MTLLRVGFSKPANLQQEDFIQSLARELNCPPRLVSVRMLADQTESSALVTLPLAVAVNFFWEMLSSHELMATLGIQDAFPVGQLFYVAASPSMRHGMLQPRILPDEGMSGCQFAYKKGTNTCIWRSISGDSDDNEKNGSFFMRRLLLLVGSVLQQLSR